MTVEIVKLDFSAPVHFGSKRLSDSGMCISSDTLFSALFIEALKLGLDTAGLLNELVISDMFPFKGEDFYLPKPLIRVESQNDDDTSYKVFKKLKFIPAKQYLDYINGAMNAETVKKITEKSDFGESKLQTKVSLQNAEHPDGESEPYTIGTFQFYQDSGLYFLAEGSAEVLNELHGILDSLQYAGLGGKRSAGYGRFSCQIVQDMALDKLLKQKGEMHILLSTAMAEEKELESCCASARYLLKKRTGYIQSDSFTDSLVKKRDFYSFSAGSVFQKPFDGAVYDVGENGNHPVYRNAKALWLEVAK